MYVAFVTILLYYSSFIAFLPTYITQECIMIEKISPILTQFCSYDSETLEIMRRLRQYGVTPTGDKTTDKAKLHEIELKKAEQENCICNKFLTVSIAEQEKIQNKKKKKRIELNPELKSDYNQKKFEGAKALGQQIYLSIKMKKH